MWKSVPDSVTKGDPDAPLVIHGSPTIGNTASGSSPFVGKVEVFCRMAGMPYEGGMDFKHAPKGKIPYIKHGDVLLGDSTFILEYLRGTYGDRIKLAQPSSAEEKAEMIACQRICEDHLYFILGHYRWLTDEGYAANSELFRRVTNNWLFLMLGLPRYRKKAAQCLHAQGLGRHSVNDMNKLMRAILEALSTFLGKKKYYGGSKPSDTDAIVFPFIYGYLYDGIELEHTRITREFDNLVQYCDRMREEFFPEDNPCVFSSKDGKIDGLVQFV